MPNKALERAYPMYDAILIDEYQDFRDNWIELCVKLTKETSEGKKSIFLAGDRLQSIYNPKEIIWKDLGINIQGRSKLLKHSYRAGKRHIELALEFLKKDRELGEEVNKFYEGADDIVAENYDEEVGFIENEYGEIGSLLETFIFKLDYKPEEILILAPTNSRCTEIYNSLPNTIARLSEVSKTITLDKVVITTYHSSKGLEGKICILVDFDKLEKRKLAYVGMTRAAEKVYIHSRNFDGNNYAREIYDMVNG